MAKIAVVEFQANQDVAKGNKIPINQLFTNNELWREFEVLESVESDKTRINVNISKISPFQTKANNTRKMGEKTNWCVLLKRDDFARKVGAIDDIKKGDKLLVSLDKI
jgi:hypothetical protein